MIERGKAKGLSEGSAQQEIHLKAAKEFLDDKLRLLKEAIASYEKEVASPSADSRK